MTNMYFQNSLTLFICFTFKNKIKRFCRACIVSALQSPLPDMALAARRKHFHVTPSSNQQRAITNGLDQKHQAAGRLSCSGCAQPQPQRRKKAEASTFVDIKLD